MNRSITVGVDLVKWAEEAGFSNVEHKVFPLPLGTWPRDQKMVELCRPLAACLRGLDIANYWSTERDWSLQHATIS